MSRKTRSGASSSMRLDRLDAVAAFANDLDFGCAASMRRKRARAGSSSSTIMLLIRVSPASPRGMRTVTRLPPPGARFECDAGAVLVQRAQPPGHIGEARGLRIRPAGVRPFSPMPSSSTVRRIWLPSGVRRRSKVAGSGLRTQPVLQGVLDDRLEDQRRHLLRGDSGSMSMFTCRRSPKRASSMCR